MKLPIGGLLLFTSVAFITCSQVAATEREEAASEEAATIQVLNLCILPSGKVVLKCKNSGSKPVKAFKGKWVAFDDFNEASQSDDILFTSNTPVMGSNALLGGYLIQPEGIIYLANDGNQRVAMVGRLASDAFGNLEDVPPTLKKRFKAVITNVIFAEREDIDNLRKQEEAAREQERLKQLDMAHQAENAAREAERKRQFDRMITQSKTPTREIARIPMEGGEFVITDVSMKYGGALHDFGWMPNFGAGGSRAIVQDGSYSYFATQADRDKALRTLSEAIKAWKKKFPEASDNSAADAALVAQPTASPVPLIHSQTEAAMESTTTTKAVIDSLTELSPERVVTGVWDKDPRVTVSNFRSQYADKLVRYTGIVARLNQKEHLLVFKGGGFMTSAYDVQASLKDGQKPGFADVAIGDRLTITATLDRIIPPAFGIGSNSIRLNNAQIYKLGHEPAKRSK